MYTEYYLLHCFNSQASYEARHIFPASAPCEFSVSIHRPHTRPDRSAQHIAEFFLSFNSQASYEARRAAYASLSAVLAVSIHRPHTRPDFSLQWSARAGIVFQFTGLIRGPTRFGGKQMTLILFQFTGLIRGPTDSIADIIYPGWFQFTGLIRGPTFRLRYDGKLIRVSIHRPHTRPDAAAA